MHCYWPVKGGQALGDNPSGVTRNYLVVTVYTLFPAFRIRCRENLAVYAAAATACARQAQEAGRRVSRARVGGAPGEYERQVWERELDPI